MTKVIGVPSARRMSCCQATDEAADTEEDTAPDPGAAKLDPAVTTNGTEEDNLKCQKLL